MYRRRDDCFADADNDASDSMSAAGRNFHRSVSSYTQPPTLTRTLNEHCGVVRRSLKLANFCGRGLVARENQEIKSLSHDTRPILSCLQLGMISAASRTHNSRMQITEWYLRYFFLNLINGNKHHRITNEINNWNKYSSFTVNNYHDDWYPKSCPILSSRIERVLR